MAARVYDHTGAYADSGVTSVLWGTGGHSQPLTIDVHVYTNSQGDAQIDVYRDSVLTLTATATNGYSRGMAYAVFKNASLYPWATYYSVYSEFIVANFDTLNLRVGTYYPSANGAYTDGAGSYTDIDESSPDGNVNTLPATGDKKSYAVTRHGNPTLGAILAVAVNGLVASDGTRDLQAGLRIGGVDYFSNDLGLGANLSAKSIVWNTNPADGGYLPQNPATDIEIIYKAVA